MWGTLLRGPQVYNAHRAASRQEQSSAMTRMVMCRKYKQEMEGLDRPPYPGAKGQEIFENVSKQAWLEWLEHQTRLINEKHMNMMDPASRTFLTEQMDKFLSGEEFEQAEGYVPEKK